MSCCKQQAENICLDKKYLAIRTEADQWPWAHVWQLGSRQHPHARTRLWIVVDTFTFFIPIFAPAQF